MLDYYYHHRTPFYRRTWFLALLSLAIVLIGGGGLFVWKVKSDYEDRAARFDLKKLAEMESSSVIYDRYGAPLGRIFLENRDTIPFEDIPPDMIRSIVAAEDNRFFQHKGVDYYGMFRAAWKNYRAGGIRQGASTLTQQLVRNSFDLHAKTYDRKILEVFLALEVEKHYSKQKILELYLNRVYFGSGFYGLEAAARGYFGKQARNLNLADCAMLAGLLKNPNNLSPWSNRQACINARNFVLSRMLEQKLSTNQEYLSSVAEVPAIKNRKPTHSDSYAIDAIRQQVVSQVGRDNASSDGYRIYTTIDAELQKRAEETLAHRLAAIESRKDYDHQTYLEYDTLFRQRVKKQGDSDEAMPGPEYLQGSFVALDNATGAVLALVGGRDFNHSQFDRATLSARPAGTAFGPLVYAAAFDNGLFPGSLFQDNVMDNRQVMIGGMTGILGEWGAELADNAYEGAISAREALVKSKNAATVRVGMQTGLDKVIALAKKAGIQSPLRRFPATYLGSSEVTLMDLTLAYTLFPGGGSRPAHPFLIERIEDKDGSIVFQAQPSRVPVVKDTTAYEVHSCLSQVLERGTGDKAYAEYGLKNFPLGGKTGTAYNFTDDWFVGYSSAVTCGVWIGFDKPHTIYRGAFSNEVALPVWVDIMNSTFARYKPMEIPQPAGIKRFEICRSSGLLATDKCFDMLPDKTTGEPARRRTTYFEIGTEEQAPRAYCDVHGGQEIQRSLAVSSSAPPPAKGQQWPRAALAVNTSGIAAVAIKAPTVVGDEDPYHSVKPSAAAGTPVNSAATPATASANGSPAPSASPAKMEVRRAERVSPVEQPEQEGEIKIEPPAPIPF